MRTFLVSLLLIVAIKVSAQYPFPDKAFCEQIAGRTLAVELIKETDQNAKNVNAAIKEIFDEYWKFTPVEYVTTKRRIDILSKKDVKYVVLTQGDDKNQIKRTGHIDKFGMRTSSRTESVRTFKYTVFTFDFYNFKLLLPTKKKVRTITEIGFPNGDLAKMDYLFLVQQLNRLITNSLAGTPMEEFYSVDRNIETVKGLNLVILEDYIKPKERDVIGENYDYKYQLVDFKGYEDVILNRTPGNCYAKIIWSNQHKIYMWVVVNAENGDILSQLSFGGVKFGSHHTANEIIKAAHFKQIYNKFGQKINDRYN